MVREIMKDPLFLGQKSEPATKEDVAIGRDLMDTLRAPWPPIGTAAWAWRPT